jgi:hypothetical protein
LITYPSAVIDVVPRTEEATAVEPPAVPWLAYGYGLVVSLTLGHFLLGLPIQLSDSFGQMLKVQGPWRDLLYGEFTQHGYMRPLMWGELKLIQDLSGGHYFAWFRGAHVVQAVIAVLLYVRLVRPRTYLDLCVLPLGLAVLIGLHTFQGTVREAFPLNHFLTVLIYTLLAANLIMGKHRWWTDVLAVLLFVVSALTLESGLLVWVVLVGGMLTGGKGVSRAGAGVLSALLVGYFILRFPVLGVGAPDLMERSSGFGFRILDPPELVARFGSNPYVFYLYNSVSSALSVLFSEPTGGVYRLTRQVLNAELDLASSISPMASACATALVCVYGWWRRQAFLAWRLERDDQLVALFAMVLVANAVISYPYTKDVVMSPAGAFLAVAVFAATRNLMAWLPDVTSPRNSAIILSVLLATGATWAVRVTGTYLSLRRGAFVERNEWAYAEISLAADGVVMSDSDKILFRALREEALFTHPVPPPLDPPLRVVLGE